MVRISILAACMIAASPALADRNAWSLVPKDTNFERVSDRATFVSIVSERALKRFGIRLEVNPDGSIGGRAFGRAVSGAWEWQDGFFCRQLFWGSRAFGTNCQEVAFTGRDTIRFTSDRGQGDSADLRLR